VIERACPGPGACGGMYTANTSLIFLKKIIKNIIENTKSIKFSGMFD